MGMVYQACLSPEKKGQCQGGKLLQREARPCRSERDGWKRKKRVLSYKDVKSYLKVSL